MRAAALCLAACALAAAPPPARRVAVTFDDLPFGGSEGPCQATPLRSLTRALLAPIHAGRIPVTAFVIGGRCAELGEAPVRQALAAWLAAGTELGNHTYSHADLSTTAVCSYQADIVRAEPLLAAVAGRPPRFFRYPFLHAGRDLATKDAVAAFLAARGYIIAPVTIDNSDWMFAFVYADALRRGDRALAERTLGGYVPYMESVVAFFERRAVEVAGHDIPQVLLLHASALNARCLPDLLDMFRARGYAFITLAEALQDPAYRLPERYAGPGGFSWIHRWSMTAGMPNKGEPDEPPFIREAYEGKAFPRGAQPRGSQGTAGLPLEAK